ncbi:hypothetical protein HELRODRAFT_140021, partial [Helobdella robusta]|uniref:Transporter n=1 Tax=Helobdella robusta TaxID=6412 RepID=T1EIZ8_HELRO
DNNKRVVWRGKVEFILTCVGYAVGLGNIWRFPYLCYKNGGGAFLIPYFGTLALVGIPLFFLELSFGQFASLGPIAIWKINPLFKGLGYSMVITNVIITSYYNVIISWILYYVFASLNSVLPWTSCGNIWNTKFCATPDIYRNITNGSVIVNGLNVTVNQLRTPSEEYFYRKVLQMSGEFDNVGRLVWQLAICLLLCWFIVFLVLIKGISSLGKVVYVTSIFPYILLTIMLIRGVTLEGAREGLIFYLKPDWSKLKEAKVWSDAATQIFFSLALCSGGLIAMASYNAFKNNCHRDSILIPLINCGTSFYGGFAIFSVLGYMAANKNVPVSQVAASGPGLVFVVYPEGLSTMPVSTLWSLLFFLMMLTLGLSSMFSMTESFFCALMDEFGEIFFKTSRRALTTRIVFTCLFYLIGLSMVTNGGFYLFSLIDAALSGFPLLVVGVVEIFLLIYVYGLKRFSDDIEMMIGHKPNIYFKTTWSFVSPAIIIFTIVFMGVQYRPLTLFSDTYMYPPRAEIIVWSITGICIAFIPIMSLIYFCRNGGAKVRGELLKELTTPSDKWGPALEEHRSGRY